MSMCLKAQHKRMASSRAGYGDLYRIRPPAGIPVRRDIAMTGEVTLQVRLAVGGLKEKLLAALRAGTKTVLIGRK